ncbi:MAG TPA: PaaI family thioesterase [Acidimicrobiales bacterium]|nr:PaaI family thioesterase [Acidimicrobiales bacterium]
MDFPNYDAERGTAMLAAATGTGGGLPGYLGMRFTDVGPGRVVGELEVTEELLNPFGAAHGGVIAALVDHVLGAVTVPVVAPGSWPATSEFKLNLLAPARVGPMRATSTIVALSRRTAVVRVDVENGGRLIGAAQGTVTIMPPREP